MACKFANFAGGPLSLSPNPFHKPSKLHCYTTLGIRAKIRAKIRVCYDDSSKLAKRAIGSSARRVAIGKALHALAGDANGCLEVPNNYGSELAVVESGRIKIEPLEMVKRVAGSLLRVSFGISLAASCVLPLVVSLTSSVAGIFVPDEENYGISFVRIVLSKLCGGRLVEYVFSIVFGDGDPNHGIEEKRWKMIGQYISLKGGVVIAEELAPFFDPETTQKMDNDSYMLQVLLRFDGHPEVDEEGNILYHFPSLQCTASPQRGNEYVGRWDDWVIQVDKFFKEKKWEFSKIDDEHTRFLMVIIPFNLIWSVLVCLLVDDMGDMLGDMLGMANNSIVIKLVRYVYVPLLTMYVIYVVSFAAIALVRLIFIRVKNAGIVKRNKAREERAKALELPDPSLKQKLLSAQNMARRKSIGKDRIVFSSEGFI